MAAPIQLLQADLRPLCPGVCVSVVWPMALIEGVGDEVTLLFGVLLLLLILLLAWISTGTSEPPEHLFVSATGPTPLLGSSAAQRDSLLSSADTSSSSSSSTSSVSETSQAEVSPRTASSQEAKDEEGGRAEALGDGLRSRDTGGGEAGGGEGGNESSSSQRNMVVRLKFLNDTERTAQVKPQDTIGYIKRCVAYTQTGGMQRYSFPTVWSASWFKATVTARFQHLNIKLVWLANRILYFKTN